MNVTLVLSDISCLQNCAGYSTQKKKNTTKMSTSTSRSCLPHLLVLILSNIYYIHSIDLGCQGIKGRGGINEYITSWQPIDLCHNQVSMVNGIYLNSSWKWSCNESAWMPSFRI